ncbi:MAG: OB-fold domain-containing protein [bacterium]
METSFLLPQTDAPESAEFWTGTAAGELRVQHCADCGAARMPPRPMCPACHSRTASWKAMSGRGRIWSFVVPHPPLLPAWAEVAPYNVVVVELEEDAKLRFVGNLVAAADAPLNSLDPATLAIDAAVQVAFPEPIDGVVLPRWVPIGAGRP